MSNHIKKTAITAILLLLTFGLPAQKCRVTFRIKSKCDGKFMGIYTCLKDKNGQIQPETGLRNKNEVIRDKTDSSTYILNCGERYFMDISFSDNGLQPYGKRKFFYEAERDADVIIDTYRIEKYTTIFVDLPKTEEWYNCNELCEGKLTDYYENGNIRLNGNFKQGQPVGKLYFYNEDGTLDVIKKYSKPKFLYSFLDQDGKRRCVFQSKLLSITKK